MSEFKLGSVGAITTQVLKGLMDDLSTPDNQEYIQKRLVEPVYKPIQNKISAYIILSFMLNLVQLGLLIYLVWYK